MNIYVQVKQSLANMVNEMLNDNPFTFKLAVAIIIPKPKFFHLSFSAAKLFTDLDSWSPICSFHKLGSKSNSKDKLLALPNFLLFAL